MTLTTGATDPAGRSLSSNVRLYEQETQVNPIRWLILPAALTSLVSIVLFGVIQYHFVRSNLYNSSGTVYFLYSIPVQALVLFLWLTHQMPKKQALVSAMLAITPFSLIGYLAVLAVYFQFGGRL